MIEVVVALIGAAGIITGPVVLLVVSKRMTAHGVVLEEVREQVSNDHPTNLRNDVDELAATLERVEAAQGSIGTIVGALAKRVEKQTRHLGSHDAASALIVHALREADEKLWSEIRRHHPPDNGTPGT
jgi:HAMP domain-containing protein